MRKHICSHVFLQIWLTVTFGYESCSFSLIGLYLGLNSYSSRQKESPSHYFWGKEEQVRDRWRVFFIFGWYNNPKEVQLAEEWVRVWSLFQEAFISPDIRRNQHCWPSNMRLDNVKVTNWTTQNIRALRVQKSNRLLDELVRLDWAR